MNNPAQKSYQLYIGGEWVDASDGGTLDVYCPPTVNSFPLLPIATEGSVDRAVDAAWEAFETWSKTTKAERAIILNKVADLIEENAEKLALLESLDNGKPIRERAPSTWRTRSIISVTSPACCWPIRERPTCFRAT